MLSNKEIVCPNNLLDAAHKKKSVKAAIVNAGKTLPMISTQDAVKENLIEPIFIGDKKEILSCANKLKWNISGYEVIDEPIENKTAKIAAKLAVGYTLNEIRNDITRVTPVSFEPTIDYCVVKIPRFTFEKFIGIDSNLTTSCLLYTSPSPRDLSTSRMPSSA